MSSLAGQVFTNTHTKSGRIGFPGSRFIYGTSNKVKSLTENNEVKELITITYNYRTPKQFIVDKESINKVFESSMVETTPHIQITHNNYYILVMILPGIKPKLLWAIEFKNGTKLKTILNYLLIKQPINQMYKLLFKIYKYPNNIKNTFILKNSMMIKRHKAYNRLQKYLKLHNMENSIMLQKQINIRQDKGSGITNILTKVLH